MAAVEDFRVSGVPVFLAPSTQVSDGHAGAIVYFRVGQHDEVFANSGITTLTHRLIWASLPVELRDYVEAQNDGLFTRFLISAPIDEFENCFRAVAEAVSQPNWAIFEQQKQLLNASDELNGPLAEANLLHARYGTAGAGTRITKATALVNAHRDDVEKWIARGFNRENAAIVSYEAPVEHLTFTLPDGTKQDLIVNEPLPLELPAYYVGSHEGLIAFQVKARADVTSFICFAMLSKLIERRLVKMEYLTTDVSFQQRIVDSDACVLTGSFLVPPGNVNESVAAVQQSIADAANGLLSPDLLEVEAATLAAQFSEPGPGEEANYLARCRLLPDLSTPDEQQAQLGSVDMLDVTAVMRRLAASLLLQVPDDLGAGDLPVLASVSYSEVTGTTVHLDRSARLSDWHKTMTFGPQGLTLRDKTGVLTIPFVDCTALFDNGLDVTLVSRTGRMLRIEPNRWTKGSELLQCVRENVASSVVVHTDASDGDVDRHERAAQSRAIFRGRKAIGHLLLFAGIVFVGIELAVGSRSAGDRADIFRPLAGMLFIAVVATTLRRRRRR